MRARISSCVKEIIGSSSSLRVGLALPFFRFAFTGGVTRASTYESTLSADAQLLDERCTFCSSGMSLVELSALRRLAKFLVVRSKLCFSCSFATLSVNDHRHHMMIE